MNLSMRKYLSYVAPLLLGAVVYTNPLYCADTDYKQEQIKISVGSNLIEVISRRTLVDRAVPDHYSIQKMFDGNKATAWVTHFNENPTGEELEEGLFKIVFEPSIYLKSVSIKNGCQLSERLFYANERVKQFDIDKGIIGGRSYPMPKTVELKDGLEEQEISLTKGWADSINLFPTRELVFNVRDIFKGKRYKDLCVSEMKFNYATKSNYSPRMPWKVLKDLISKNSIKVNRGWDWNESYKKDDTLFVDLLYYVLERNKDAYALFDTYTPLSVADSEAMNNIYRKAVSEFLENKK